MTTTISGTTGVTYPVQAGGTSQVQSSSGKVLQVVMGSTTAADSTSSSSYVASSLYATITPSSSSSKILILMSGTIWTLNSGNQMVLTIYRDATDLAPAAGFTQSYAGSSTVETPVAIHYLDAPATTSAITYKAYFRSTLSVQGYFGANNLLQTMILMEIAA